MGKKKESGVVEENKEDKEGKNILGLPTFKKLENGRFKCVETGHELPADARESYAQSKHCRLGLIHSTLARNKPPLNMFHQDPLSRSRLICKLTGHTVNKTEEHIWKHINGKRFLNMLEKKEAEAAAGKQEPNEIMEEGNEQKPEKVSKSKGDVLKKKKKEKKEKKQEENVTEPVSEMRNLSDKDSDSEEDEFWMPPVGERWDFDDGGDRWGSDSDSGVESDDANEADSAGEESNNDTGDLSKRTKRMSIEIGPSAFASRKKKKIQST